MPSPDPPRIVLRRARQRWGSPVPTRRSDPAAFEPAAASFRLADGVPRMSAASVESDFGNFPMRTPEIHFKIRLASVFRRRANLPVRTRTPHPFVSTSSLAGFQIAPIPRMSELKPTILLVEDNEEDAFLLRRALRQRKDQLFAAARRRRSRPRSNTSTVKENMPTATRIQFPALVLLDL